MGFTVNIDAIKKKLQEQKEAAEKKGNKKKDPSDSIILKVAEEGKLKFRAVPYPHNDNPEDEPWIEKWYHFGVPGNYIFYCPKKNDDKDCHLCDFIWGQMSENKGNKEVVKEWAAKLPKLNAFFAGKVRGREEEGAKLLKIGTQEDKPSDKMQSIYEFFLDEDTRHWLDPENGFDLEVEYEKNAQYGFIPKKGKLTLARKSSPFGKKGEYEKFLETVPDLLKNVPGYEPKTTEQSLAALEVWAKRLGEKAPVVDDTSDGVDTSGVEGGEEEVPSAVTSGNLQARLAQLGIKG